MNLKNSKFYKRIQELRNFSKEKIRKDREQRGLRTPVIRGVEMALSESKCVAPVIELEWSQLAGPLKETCSPRRRPSPTKIKHSKKKASAAAEPRLKGGQGFQPVKTIGLNDEAPVEGYIDLNNLRFRVACTARTDTSPRREEILKVR